ncbi:hypothetical protein LOAG_02474 [Loa loa]|uniref:Uncharacterized protein n=1 Tax=Loa loa TaxID=7209 RepID=A0A1S0U757_LOALO|nr:hypothetical protein LOAG_02474 [Loa loa]EFO26015.1 hypothetical protein LOAG_02474 [Loa loa]
MKQLTINSVSRCKVAKKRRPIANNKSSPEVTVVKQCKKTFGVENLLLKKENEIHINRQREESKCTMERVVAYRSSGKGMLMGDNLGTAWRYSIIDERVDTGEVC